MKVLRSNIGGTIIDTPILDACDERAAQIAMEMTNMIPNASAEIIEIEDER